MVHEELPELPPRDIETLNVNDEDTVAMIEMETDADRWDRVAVDLDVLEEFIDWCRDMGWEEVDLHLSQHDVIFAHDRGEDIGVYVAMAPMVPDDMWERVRGEE